MRILVTAVLLAVWSSPCALARTLEESLDLAGDNRAQLQAAIDNTSPDERWGMVWLIDHMPPDDLRTLTADFLIEHVHGAFAAWQASPWHDDVSADIFKEGILPYASVNERRDAWRAPLAEISRPLIEGAQSTGEAVTKLNKGVFSKVNVKYSTARPKADQSPAETIDAGMASCTGLSILLIDSCRSVGVPARFVGTPLWSDNSGNHSWVEVWHDGDWHFTGAAEPAGDNLDAAWFAGRASGAIEGDPRHAIYAVTWSDTPQHFPLVWRPTDTSYGAIDVTDRYTTGKAKLPEGKGRLRIRTVDSGGNRRAHAVGIFSAQGNRLLTGMTRGRNADANDHLTGLLPLGETFTIEVAGVGTPVVFEHDEQLVTVQIDQPALEGSHVDDVVGAWRAKHVERAREELASRELRHGEHVMPIFFSRHGEIPPGGRSLYISMHGGGGAPAHVNDAQWKNQQRLYTIDEGIYVAPRAPTNTWNLWHEGHIDPLFDKLITNMILAEDVNPDRVYLTGFSAGGDGVFQLAPRMADRFAGAAMMAGHPNETKPDGLRNLPFTLHTGARDGAYDRNAKAAQWKQWLHDLAASDEGGYPHWVKLHEGKGHWMNREEAAGLPWMAKHTRDLRPKRIVWLQDDITHDRFYWLKVDNPVARDRVVVERDGQTITIVEPGAAKTLSIRLDASMVDLSKPIRVVTADGVVFFEGVAASSVDILAKTLSERGDPGGMFSAEVSVSLGR